MKFQNFFYQEIALPILLTMFEIFPTSTDLRNLMSLLSVQNSVVNMYLMIINIGSICNLYYLANADFHIDGGLEGGLLILHFLSIFSRFPHPALFFITIPNPVFVSQKNTLESLISTRANKCKM